jgi:hypothetical protein
VSTVSDLTVANEILNQLGGQRFRAMTGAKSFVGSGDALTFRLPTGLAKDRINCVRITLTPADDYKIETMAIRGLNVKPVATEEGVFVDTLRATFKAMTGLDTSL